MGTLDGTGHPVASGSNRCPRSCRAHSLSPTDHQAAFYLALQLAISRQVSPAGPAPGARRPGCAGPRHRWGQAPRLSPRLPLPPGDARPPPASCCSGKGFPRLSSSGRQRIPTRILPSIFPFSEISLGQSTIKCFLTSRLQAVTRSSPNSSGSWTPGWPKTRIGASKAAIR